MVSRVVFYFASYAAFTNDVSVFSLSRLTERCTTCFWDHTVAACEVSLGMVTNTDSSCDTGEQPDRHRPERGQALQG